jgi:hypothetical protein
VVLLAGFGGGMNVGACVLRWHGSIRWPDRRRQPRPVERPLAD